MNNENETTVQLKIRRTERLEYDRVQKAWSFNDAFPEVNFVHVANKAVKTGSRPFFWLIL